MKNWIGVVVVGRGQRERTEDGPGNQSHAAHQGREYKEKERVCVKTPAPSFGKVWFSCLWHLGTRPVGCWPCGSEQAL